MTIVAVCNEFLSEFAILNALQDFLHSFTRLLVDYLRTSIVLAVFSGVGDRVIHEVDARFVHQVYDHLHLVIALEVSKLGRITSVYQGLETSLYQLY